MWRPRPRPAGEWSEARKDSRRFQTRSSYCTPCSSMFPRNKFASMGPGPPSKHNRLCSPSCPPGTGPLRCRSLKITINPALHLLHLWQICFFFLTKICKWLPYRLVLQERTVRILWTKKNGTRQNELKMVGMHWRIETRTTAHKRPSTAAVIRAQTR